MTIRTLTKDQNRRVLGFLVKYQQALMTGEVRPDPVEAAMDYATLGALIGAYQEIVHTQAHAVERGAKILELRLNPEHAPTQNEMSAIFGRRLFVKKRISQELDRKLQAEIATTPSLRLAAGAMRWVRVTRFTPQVKLVDDAAVDAIGGKMPVDALVRAGILAGDTPKHVRREAHVLPTKRGNTHVLLELFEIAREEVPDPGPQDGPAPPKTERKFGRMTKAIVGEDARPAGGGLGRKRGVVREKEVG